ncbi:MAG TPA: hypothetical protein VGK78_15095 [Nocardioides sp.]|uniref:helix-turn-helix transcriptional regulator n=1 Tax=Nocardioides sp. TaxID=35761 RepID=UPI002F404998
MERPAASRHRGWEETLDGVAVLADGVRRRVYAYARSAPTPVTREETAGAVGISRKLAAFHLDKLVKAGLLSSRSADRPSQRRVGRRPKEYEPAQPDIHLSIPARRHELLAQILADALTGAAQDEPPAAAVPRVARERGRAEGIATHGSVTGTSEDDFARATAAVQERGYEPVLRHDGSLRLRNCVFAPISAGSRELVCSLHHAYLSGLLEGLGAGGLSVVKAPAAGECCVELRPGADGGS